MSDSIKIRRALISVYDKTGIVEFARALHEEFGIEIISSGGTAKVLREAGIPVTLVEDITGFPEMLDGRVKTLHPKIHAAILADRDNPEHTRQLAEQGIEPIDMVVVNLYPFEETIAKPDCTFEEAIEMIDIGGPCLLRAAAKNHKHVLVLSDPCHYRRTAGFIRGETRGLGKDWRGWLLTKAFQETAAYEIAIHNYFARRLWQTPFTPAFFLDLGLMTPTTRNELRYGENPHQRASIYTVPGPLAGLWGSSGVQTVIDGKEESMSFNNYHDASAALELCAELTRAHTSDDPRTHTSKEPRASARAVLPTEPAPDLSTVFHEPDPHHSAWLLTWTTYGSWLPGDARGFVSRRPSSDAGRVIRNIPGTPYDVDQKDVEEAARERMQGKPVTLERAHVLTVLGAFIEAARNHSISIVALSIMPDHVHLLCQGAQSGSELMQLFKGVSARRLGQAHPLTSAPRWWTKAGSKRHFRKREDLQPVVSYVCQQKGALWAGSFADAAPPDVTEALNTARAEARGSLPAPEAEARGSSPARGSYAACFIKHTNACGAAVEAPKDPSAQACKAAALEVYRKAYLGDPNAAMGGILAVNFPVDAEFATAVMETYQRWGKPLKEAGHPAAPGAFFIEVWLAPSFDEEAVQIIRGEREGAPQKAWGQRVRLLDVGDMSVEPDPNEMDFKRIAGGMLVQGRDLVGLNEDPWKVVTERKPTDAEMDDLRLAWLICKHTKSNAITICRDGLLIGNGAGQMSRVMSCRIATWLAKENGHEEKLTGAAAASDAFFPFRDGPDILADAGVTAIIQPGGSKRDEDTIAACNERGVAMVFTGTRHFKH